MPILAGNKLPFQINWLKREAGKDKFCPCPPKLRKKAGYLLVL
jgi:hypothetical protein